MDLAIGYARAIRLSAIHFFTRENVIEPIMDGCFDILTIVFADDLHLLALQARSFDLYLDTAFAGRIIVIVNDLRCASAVRHVEQSIKHHYGKWQERVIVIPFYKVAYRLDPANGWIIQQVIKLVASNIINKSHYVVFDAKNHLVAPTQCSFFVDTLANQHFTNDPHHLRQHDHVCSSYFGLDPNDTARRRFVPMTPFVFHTQSVRDLVSCLQAREGASLSDIFCRRRLLSEFLLYGAYLDAHAGGTATLYRSVACRTTTIWPGDDVRALIASANACDTFCFGVHRRYLAEAGSSATAALEAYWRKTRLLGEQECLASLGSLGLGAKAAVFANLQIGTTRDSAPNPPAGGRQTPTRWSSKGMDRRDGSTIIPSVVSRLVESFSDLWVALVYASAVGFFCLCDVAVDQGMPPLWTCTECMAFPPFFVSLLIVGDALFDRYKR